ncbi:TetR/AcrR family transcriptional regulator C-terminal domain-containing protein [Amphritea sp. 1_MG-2023]|uniref:TetR/AcrR family transcriptional regulator C-terminal domain-containing protein n=1 Tax=Amphritea sp. 1_MG-2023 TaxID=3062670 RepID=UPI0034A0DF72
MRYSRCNNRNRDLKVGLARRLKIIAQKRPSPHYASEQFMGLIKSVSFWPLRLMNQPLPEAQQCQKTVDDSVSMFLHFYPR